MSLSLREAALQALSAIEDSGHRYHLMAAADALRAALAEAPKAEPETGTYLDQIAEAKRDMEQWPGWMKDAATIGAAAPPKTEPVAWALAYREDPDDYDHFTTVASTMKRWVEDEDNIAVPLYTHPPEPVAWTPVTTRRPPWDERKVVCYTEGYDYGGSQFITMPASDFHCYDEDDPDEPGSRESKTVSHWIYEDDLVRAVLAHGRE